MSIYVTGDIHGNPVRFSSESFYEQKEFKDQNKNFCIILGDFGLVWDYTGDSKREKYWLDWLEEKNFTTLFIDGNHECVNKDTDILTESGWINIQKLYESNERIKIATVDLETHELIYDYPLNKIKNFSEYIIDFDGINYKQSVTENHDVIINGKKVKAKELIDKHIIESDLRFEILNYENGVELNNNIIEILTAIVMDGTIVDYSIKNPNSHKIRIQFHLKKIRKINYIMNILDEENIHYTIRYGKNDDVYICIHGDQGRYLYKLLEYKKELPSYFRNLSKTQFQFMINAIIQTDGTPRNTSVIWNTTSLNDVDIVEDLCIKYNYDIRVKTEDNASGYTKNCKTQYKCSFGYNKKLDKRIKINKRKYNDYVYCFTMPKGTLVTRYNYVPCITGNCFDRLYDYPVCEWNGGKVHYIRPHVIHLMRGQVFTIEDKKFFTFGGASSHDIKDGILDPEEFNSPAEFRKTAHQWDREYKQFRIKGMSWWSQELPTQEEMDEGIKNLIKHDNKVDFILSHSPSTSELYLMGGKGFYEPDMLTNYLEEIKATTEYKRHMFGHMHCNKAINDKDICLYEQIIRIN